MKRRVLLTTTAYPPSTGGAQANVFELRERLTNFDADVLTLWLQNRSDWLLGTTLRLGGQGLTQASPGVTTVGWSSGARLRMLPWVMSYYLNPALTSKRIAAQMVPYVELAVHQEHQLIHNHRIGREFLAQASLAVARRRRIPFVLTPNHHPRWRGYRYQGWLDVYRAADAVLTLTQVEAEELQRLGVSKPRELRPQTPHQLAERILASRAAVEGERKQVTVLFADVKGSMELAERLDPEQWLEIMDRCLQLLTDRTYLRSQMQAYAACDDPEICEVVRNGFGDLVAYVERVSGLPPEDVTKFFACGMLLNVFASMNLDREPEPWAQRLMGGLDLDH